MKRQLRSLIRRRPITIYSAQDHLDGFLVSAIATVLLTRLFLFVTGYPQIGGGGLHIAHIMLGGLLMLASLVLLTTLLGDRPRATATIIGGIGFGLFIDELGKFITRDNNYFFKPTALLIYGIFLALYFIFRQIIRRRSQGQRAHQANLLELLQEGLLFGYTPQEKISLDHLLDKLDKSPLSQQLIAVAAIVRQQARNDEPSIYRRLTSFISKKYLKLVAWRFFIPLLYGIFLVQGVVSLYTLADFIADLSGNRLATDLGNEAFRAQLGQLSGGFIYGVIVLIGLARFRSSRLKAYNTFKNALLINIFVTQFFAFYRSQFWAAAGLLLSLVLLWIVNYLIRLERRRPRNKLER